MASSESLSSASSESCDPFEYHPRGRKGIGVAQPQGGSDYPFVAPSDDIRYLLADFYLAFPAAEYALPLRIAYLKGLGCEGGAPDGIPSHDNDDDHAVALVVVDADDVIVFDSRDGDLRVDRDWGPRLHVYSWQVDGMTASVVVHTKWSPDDQPEPRQYAYHILPENGVLDVRATFPVPRKVTSLQVVLENLTQTAVELLPGYNMKITHQDTTATPGGRRRHQIRFDATAGAGLGQFPGCGTDPLAIKKINNVLPTDAGDFFLAATDCYFVRQPTIITQESPRRAYPSVLLYPYNLPDIDLPDPLAGQSTDAAGWPLSKRYGHLQLGNDCVPCCDCEDFVELAEYMNRIRDQYSDIGQDAMAVRDLYHVNRDRFNAARDCFHRRPLRIFMQPQLCPFMDVVIQFCNQSQNCVEDLELSVTFQIADDTGSAVQVPGFSMITGAHTKPGRRSPLTERYSLGGMWPTFTAHWDGVEPGASAYVKFRLEFDDCFLPYVVTGTVTGSAGGDPILVANKDTDVLEAASDTDTKTLDCPANADAMFDPGECYREAMASSEGA